MISWAARQHWSLRALAAVGFGVLTAVGFAPFGWWPLTVLGVAGFTIVIAAAARLRGALGLGYLYGWGFLGLGLNWMQAIFVQAMVGLVAVEAVFYLVLAGLLRAALQTRWWPLGAAAAWTIVEFAISRFPFGGFGWMRLGYAFTDSPLAWGFPLFGVAGVGFIAALISQGLAWFSNAPSRRRAAITAGGLAGLIGISAAGLAIAPGASSGSVAVGWVQGGAPGGGIFGLGPARTITRNQVAETERLAEKIDAGTLPRPAFIVWPENSTDLDPFTDAQTAALVNESLQRTGLPILVGSVPDGPGPDQRQTVSLWWDPTSGVQQRYAKRAIVPFGEWVPLKDLLLPLIPELRYVGAQSVAGTQPGVLTPVLSDGRTLKVGVLICYDVAFDNVVADTATNGAQIELVQSSNAMFQGTGQIEQQFQITRARAMELRREILVVTTSGISGLIEPDGSVVWRTSDYTSASGVVSLPQRSGVTFAASYGWLVEAALVGAGLAGLTWSAIWGRMAKSKRESGAQHG